MNDIEIKPEIVKSIKNGAMILEGMNLQQPQDRRATHMEMLRRHIEKIKIELKSEKEKMS
ncbi:MAG: hypothetical protein PUF06_07520 [Veillonellaceae bacterium]|nr:hypothetical protein [Veillonellaceae bacterium]MDD6562961.1 hypothetical protein [Veillonellaceae bacterium]